MKRTPVTDHGTAVTRGSELRGVFVVVSLGVVSGCVITPTVRGVFVVVGNFSRLGVDIIPNFSPI